jgi:hypothetical protein
LADKILPIGDKLKELARRGAEIDISCFWSSKNGQGVQLFHQFNFRNSPNLRLRYGLIFTNEKLQSSQLSKTLLGMLRHKQSIAQQRLKQPQIFSYL